MKNLHGHLGSYQIRDNGNTGCFELNRAIYKVSISSDYKIITVKLEQSNLERMKNKFFSALRAISGKRFCAEKMSSRLVEIPIGNYIRQAMSDDMKKYAGLENGGVFQTIGRILSNEENSIYKSSTKIVYILNQQTISQLQAERILEIIPDLRNMIHFDIQSNTFQSIVPAELRAIDEATPPFYSESLPRKPLVLTPPNVTH